MSLALYRPIFKKHYAGDDTNNDSYRKWDK